MTNMVTRGSLLRHPAGMLDRQMPALLPQIPLIARLFAGSHWLVLQQLRRPQVSHRATQGLLGDPISIPIPPQWRNLGYTR